MLEEALCRAVNERLFVFIFFNILDSLIAGIAFAHRSGGLLTCGVNDFLGFFRRIRADQKLHRNAITLAHESPFPFN